MYGGNSGDAYTTPATNIKIRSNRYACGDWLYGPVAAVQHEQLRQRVDRQLLRRDRRELSY